VFIFLFSGAGVALLFANYTHQPIWDWISMGMFLDTGIWFIVVAFVVYGAEYDPSNPNYNPMDTFPDAVGMIGCTLFPCIVAASFGRRLPA